MTIQMPALKQTPSPNYSPTLIAHDLVIVHMMEGGYAGSVAWMCRLGGAAPHVAMSEDGSEVTQLVPLQFKAWAECSFNGRGVSLEIPGFTAQGIPSKRWAAAANIVAWLCRAYAIPPVWARGGQGRGVCQHHDLGAAGGGHVDCSEIGSPTWLMFMQFVEESYNAFGDGALPAWALHGLPAPQSVELPPAVTPTPSHGGADRSEPGDTATHATKSGFPLGSIGDWQFRLREVGANPMLGLDNDEGPATRAAIGIFQRAEGLPVTNDVNPATWAKLFAPDRLKERMMDGNQIGGIIRALTPAVVAIGGIYGLDSATLTTVLTALATLIVAVWSIWKNSQTAMIQAVNAAPNGVKVVAEATVAPTATQPIKKGP